MTAKELIESDPVVIEQKAVVDQTDSVVVVVILGTSAGTLLPLGLRRSGMDPAIMSNPLIAAMIDILAVVIFYEIAGQYLN